jgi:hypothetical protein
MWEYLLDSPTRVGGWANLCESQSLEEAHVLWGNISKLFVDVEVCFNLLKMIFSPLYKKLNLQV